LRVAPARSRQLNAKPLGGRQGRWRPEQGKRI